MKKAIYLSLLMGGLITLGACEGSEYDLENQIPEKFHKILYLDVSGKQDLTLYNTEEDNVYSFSIIKAGSNPSLTAAVDLTVLTQEEVDTKYSELEEVNYKIIGTNAYSVDNTTLNFSADEQYKMVNVALKASEVIAAMESEPDAVWVLPFYVKSEKDSINSYKNELFLQLTEVITPAIGFTNTDVVMRSYDYGTVSTISEKIPFKFDTDNKWDIECELVVDESYVATYNADKKTVFKLLPEGTYTMPNVVSLPNGTTSSELLVTIEGQQLQPGDYMLPIKFSSISKFEINDKVALYPLTIRILGEQLDRKTWKIEANTEEVSGEGANNGRAIHAIDGDFGTFWHSQWQNGSHALPHELIIDTQEERTFTQFALARRLDNDYVRAGKFYVSSDKETWEEVGTFALKQENGVQVFGINPMKGRYFKVQVTESNNGGGHTCLSEIYAYGIK